MPIQGTVILNGELIERQMLGRGWYRSDLIAKAGLVYATIARALGGKPVSVGTARAIADALRLPVRKIIRETHGRAGTPILAGLAFEDFNQGARRLAKLVSGEGIEKSNALRRAIVAAASGESDSALMRVIKQANAGRGVDAGEPCESDIPARSPARAGDADS